MIFLLVQKFLYKIYNICSQCLNICLFLNNVLRYAIIWFFLSSNMIRTFNELTVLSLQTVTLACLCCRYTNRFKLCLTCRAAAQQQHSEFKWVGARGDLLLGTRRFEFKWVGARGDLLLGTRRFGGGGPTNYFVTNQLVLG